MSITIFAKGERQEQLCSKCGKDELRLGTWGRSNSIGTFTVRQCHACGEHDEVLQEDIRAHPSIRIARERNELERFADLLRKHPDLALQIHQLLKEGAK